MSTDDQAPGFGWRDLALKERHQRKQCPCGERSVMGIPASVSCGGRTNSKARDETGGYEHANIGSTSLQCTTKHGQRRGQGERLSPTKRVGRLGGQNGPYQTAGDVNTTDSTDELRCIRGGVEAHVGTGRESIRSHKTCWL